MAAQRGAVTRLALLTPRAVAKTWGSLGAGRPYGANAEERIGEIWFEGSQTDAPSLLVKRLFTSDYLSVQVHPDDATARKYGEVQGKSECWLITAAAPSARVAIGTDRAMAEAPLEAAARSGAILHRLHWFDARPGDFYSVPAGTIHAMGPGLELVEIQQPSDITYRLFDHGRDRPLQIDRAVAAASAKPHDEALDGPAGAVSRMLVTGPHFAVAWCVGAPPDLPEVIPGAQLIALDDPVICADETLAPRCCALLRSGWRDCTSSGNFLIAWPIT